MAGFLCLLLFFWVLVEWPWFVHELEDTSANQPTDPLVARIRLARWLAGEKSLRSIDEE